MRTVIARIRRRLAVRRRVVEAVPREAERLISAMAPDEALAAAEERGRENPGYSLFWRLVWKEIRRRSEQ